MAQAWAWGPKATPPVCYFLVSPAPWPFVWVALPQARTFQAALGSETVLARALRRMPFGSVPSIKGTPPCLFMFMKTTCSYSQVVKELNSVLR